MVGIAEAHFFGDLFDERSGTLKACRRMVHLQAEERYFLSSKVLRDDVVSVESSG